MTATRHNPEALDLQPRDIAVLRTLLESRLMTLEHASALHFEGRYEAAKKRLHKLKAAGFVSSRPRRPYEPLVYFLSKNGLRVLQEAGILRQYASLSLPTLERRSMVGRLAVAHELQVMDVKVAFHRALATQTLFSLAAFTTWPAISQFEVVHRSRSGAVRTVVKPDGFIHLVSRHSEGRRSEHCLFLELDRSTETLDSLLTRASHYLEFYRSGGFALRRGGSRTAIQDYPFRVLMVVPSIDRRDHLAERLLEQHPPILTQVWLTTFKQVCDDPLGAIWLRPLDARMKPSIGEGGRPQLHSLLE